MTGIYRNVVDTMIPVRECEKVGMINIQDSGTSTYTEGPPCTKLYWRRTRIVYAAAEWINLR